MAHVQEIYGSMVFNEHVMKERLPKETYKSLVKTVREGKPLDIEVANVVAHAMKEWAIERGATHYTHWFQPLTGITSEKHDSFFPVKSWYRASLMPPASPQAVCVQRLKPVVTLRGILLRLHSLKTKFFVSLRHFVHTQVKRSTRRPPYFAL